MVRRVSYLMLYILLVISMILNAQQPQEAPIFTNEGETVVYHLTRDPQGRQGTVSDALQNVPGVKVDTEGNISLRGVSEVVIFINGRPSHFDEESQKNYLQQVSATTIDHIEVMTNPSARFTTVTDTGVINIVTDESHSSERHLSVGLQTNTRPEISPWVSYIWSNRKAAFTVNLKGSYSRNWEHTESYSYSFVDHEDLLRDLPMDTASHQHAMSDDSTHNYGVELFLKGEFHPDPSNDLMMYFNISPEIRDIRSYSEIYRKEYLNHPDIYEYTTHSSNRQPMTWGSAGMSWHHRFPKEGHALGIQLNSDYDFGGGLETEVRTFRHHPMMNRDLVITNDFLDIGIDGKMEYVYPYSKQGEIYVSASNVFKPDNNICLYDTLGVDGYVNDALRSENRKFGRNQTTGTVMLQHHLGRFTIKPGLSFETMAIKLRYFDFPEYDTLMHFSHWLPSLHLSYRTESQHNFSFSYTRKTSYPWARYFTRRIGYEEDSYTVGNPFLKPTLIESFELSWSKYWDRRGSMSVKGYHHNSIHAINEVSDVAYDDYFGRVVPFRIPVNLNKYFESGAEFNLTYRPNAKFNVRLDANVFDSYIESFYDKTGDSIIRSELWAYNLRLSTWAKLWDKLEVHATAYYNSPTQTLFATRQTAYGINFGLRADFFDKRLSVLLNAFDIFNWNKEDNYTFNPYYLSYSSYRANSRYVSLELIYRML